MKRLTSLAVAGASVALLAGCGAQAATPAAPMTTSQTSTYIAEPDSIALRAKLNCDTVYDRARVNDFLPPTHQTIVDAWGCSWADGSLIAVRLKDAASAKLYFNDSLVDRKDKHTISGTWVFLASSFDTGVRAQEAYKEASSN